MIPFIGSLVTGIGTKLLIGAIIVSLAGGLYFYVQSIRSDNARLLQNETVLEDVIQAKEVELEERRKAFLIQVQANKVIEEQNQVSQKRVSELLKVLGDGRLGRIAKKKPGLIQTRINKANREWNQEMRLLTEPKSYD